MSMTITPSQASDYAEVLALLREVNLPTEGVLENFHNFLVARATTGRLAGCVGQERYGNVALLRSLAINPVFQGHGLGRELTLELLSVARSQKTEEVVLLTNTAADFFQRHFGFSPVERARYETVLQDSPEWKLLRCASAVCLSLPLV